MPLTEDTLKKLAITAHLDLEPDTTALLDDINFIMDYVDSLREVNTHAVLAQINPLDEFSRLREDVVNSDSCVAELAAIAPLVVDELYIVPDDLETQA